MNLFEAELDLSTVCYCQLIEIDISQCAPPLRLTDAELYELMDDEEEDDDEDSGKP